MTDKKNKKIHKFIFMFLICGILGIVSTLAFDKIVLQNALNNYITLAWTNHLFKLRQKYNPKNNKASKDIIVILFDNDTNARMKTFWPYDRKDIASVINFLSLAGAQSIVFDILFSEPNPDKLESDTALIKSVNDAGNVILGSKFAISKSKKTDDTKEVLNFTVNLNFSDNKLNLSDFQHATNNQIFITPFKELLKVTKKIGFFNAVKTDDLTRYAIFVLCNSDYCYPSLPLSAYLNKINSNDVRYEPEKYMQIKNLTVPLDKNNHFTINWLGGKNDISTDKEKYKDFIYTYKPAWMLIESYDSILNASKRFNITPKTAYDHWYYDTNKKVQDSIKLNIDPDLFKDKIVFVGISSSGAHDYINTPFGQMPGVFQHSFILDNLMTKRFIYTPDNSLLIVLLLSFLTSLTVIYASSKDRIFLLILPITYILLYSLICMHLFIFYNINLNWIMPSLSIVLTFFLGIIYYFFAEGKEKKKVKRAMSNYLSPQIMKIIIENPELVSTSSIQRKTVTIFFFDIRSFTTICENNPPELIAKFLNEYHSAVINAIFKNGGTLDKIIGDAVLAFWNAPVDIDNHPLLAIKSALEVKQNLKELNLTWEKILKQDVDYGIGINTQEVVVGNIGSDSFMDYTVVGDGVNLAARLEGLNKKYETNIIISEYTYKLTCDKIYTRYLDITTVKGKAIETKIYEVLRIRD